MDKVKRLLDEKGTAVFSVSHEATVWEAVSVLTEKKIGAVLVFQEDHVLGVFTERDLLTRVILEGRDPKATNVRDVMSADMVYVTPETPIHEAMAVMTERRCRHLPVMVEGKVAGLVSIGDCTRWVSRDQNFTIHHLTQYIHGKYPA